MADEDPTPEDRKKARNREKSRLHQIKVRAEARKDPEKWAAMVAYQVAYREAHREENRQYAKAYRKANSDKCRDAQAAYWNARPGAAWAKNRRWRANNPEGHRVHQASRKGRERGAIGTYTPSDIDRIAKGQRHRCGYCKVSIKHGYHIDHITPLSKGGSNWPANLQLLCEPCNLKKNAADPIDYAQRIGLLL